MTCWPISCRLSLLQRSTFTEPREGSSFQALLSLPSYFECYLCGRVHRFKATVSLLIGQTSSVVPQHWLCLPSCCSYQLHLVGSILGRLIIVYRYCIFADDVRSIVIHSNHSSLANMVGAAKRRNARNRQGGPDGNSNATEPNVAARDQATAGPEVEFSEEAGFVERTLEHADPKNANERRVMELKGQYYSQVSYVSLFASTAWRI